MSLRSTFYDALRAAPLYPRGRATFALFLLAVAVGQDLYGWPATAALFTLLAVVAVAAADGVPRAVASLLLVLAILAACVYVMSRWSPALLVLAGLILWAAITAQWMLTQVAPTFTTAGLIARRGDREQRAGGVAGPWDIAERSSRAAIALRAAVMRPSLAGVRRRRIDPWQIGSMVVEVEGWSGLRRLTRHVREVWAAIEDTTLRVGGPRTGKTVSLALVAARAPGALLTTSTRLDLAEWVHEARRVVREYGRRSFRQWLRARRELGVRNVRQRLPQVVVSERRRAVHIFNPTGYGKLPSTVRWSVLEGCDDYSTAARRAADLIPVSTSVEGERWDKMAREFLPILLHAAARGERGVEAVARWVRDIGDEKTKERAKEQITDILAAEAGADMRIGLLNQLIALPERTRGSITGMMSPALAWIADDTARQIGAAPVGTITLDVRRFILEQETLHIIGPDAGGGILSPLTSALVAEIAYQARMLASTMPGERLDPPLTMTIDEAAVTVRLPLDEWSADMGGRGIHLDMSVQSLSQLTERWGRAGAGTLLGNIGTLLLYGGGKDADELARVSELCGTRRMRVVGEDHDGVDGRRDGQARGEWRWVPVLTPAQLMNMLPGYAVVLQRNLGGAVVGRTPRTYDVGMARLSLIDGDLVLDGELVDEAPALVQLSGEEAA